MKNSFIYVIIQVCHNMMTYLKCAAPPFPRKSFSSSRRRARTDATVANLTLILDGFIHEGGEIEYYPDPVYYSFNTPDQVFTLPNNRLLQLNVSTNHAASLLR